jgi:hypothetical protein
MSQPDLLDALRALALPDECPSLSAAELIISRHAVERYRERVEGVCRRRAQSELRRLALDARWYPMPRPWTQIVVHPGSHFGYSPRRPDICIIERAGAIRTVFSRRSLAAPPGPPRQSWRGARATALTHPPGQSVW